MPEVMSGGEFEPSIAHRLRPRRWAWQDRLPIGYLSLIIGVEGIGKSSLAAWMIARLTHSDLPGNLRHRAVNVALVGDEDSFQHVLDPAIARCGADLGCPSVAARLDLEYLLSAVDVSCERQDVDERKIAIRVNVPGERGAHEQDVSELKLGIVVVGVNAVRAEAVHRFGDDHAGGTSKAAKDVGRPSLHGQAGFPLPPRAGPEGLAAFTPDRQMRRRDGSVERHGERVGRQDATRVGRLRGAGRSRRGEREHGG
jgi:hypothetical protein